MAPTLVTSCTALPPEGAHFALGRPSGKISAPTLVTSCTALPPEGANFGFATLREPWGGPAENCRPKRGGA
jgi:hypothetical protein